jgi:spermidine synthase
MISSLTLILGASGMLAQMAALREMIVVFSGNELSIGIVFANWLVLEAAGAWLAGRAKDPAGAFVLTQGAFAACLPACVLAVRGLKPLLGAAPGEILGLWTMAYSSLLILAPLALSHGALFALACALRPEASGSEAAGKAYFIETSGSVLGALLLTFLLAGRFDALSIASGVACLDFLACAVLSLRADRAPKAAASLAAFAASGAFLLSGAASRLHESSVRRQWAGQEVVFYGNSPYGNVAVLKSGGQFSFLTDGRPALAVPVPDVESCEEFAHLALLAHPDPKEVLVLGGGAGGLLAEILKHPVRRVDYAELDPLLIEAVRKFPAPVTRAELADPRVRLAETDGRLFLREAAASFDAVVVGGAEPSNIASNRLYTREFFSLARERLGPGGLLALSLPGSSSYMDENLVDLDASVLGALREVFARVEVVPGEVNRVIAFRDPGPAGLDARALRARLAGRAIKTRVVGPAHVDYLLEAGRLDRFRRTMASGAPAGVNSDFRPLAVFFSTARWSAMLSPGAGRFLRGLKSLSLGRFALGVVLLTAVLAWRRPGARVPASLACTGFAGMVMSLALVFSFQAVHGCVYQWVAALTAAFMAGGSAGSLSMSLALRRYPGARAPFLGSEAALALSALALPGGIALAQGIFSFAALAAACGFLAGAQFPAAVELRARPGMLYACDLIGGFAGGLAGSAALLPVLGVAKTCAAVAVLKASSLAWALWERRLE